MSARAVYTVSEAAAAIGWSGDQMRAAIRRGDVAAEWTGGRYLLTRASLERLTGARLGADHLTGDSNMTNALNVDEWTTGRRDLTADELADFCAWWNDAAAELGRIELEKRGFHVITGPHTLHIDWPLADDRRVVVTITSPTEQWSPAPTMNPDAASNVFEALADRFADIETMVKNGANRDKIALRAWQYKQAAFDGRTVSDEARNELREIPEGTPLSGVAFVYRADDEDAAA